MKLIADSLLTDWTMSARSAGIGPQSMHHNWDSLPRFIRLVGWSGHLRILTGSERFQVLLDRGVMVRWPVFRLLVWSMDAWHGSAVAAPGGCRG